MTEVVGAHADGRFCEKDLNINRVNMNTAHRFLEAHHAAQRATPSPSAEQGVRIQISEGRAKMQTVANLFSAAGSPGPVRKAAFSPVELALRNASSPELVPRDHLVVSPSPYNTPTPPSRPSSANRPAHFIEPPQLTKQRPSPSAYLADGRPRRRPASAIVRNLGDPSPASSGKARSASSLGNPSPSHRQAPVRMRGSPASLRASHRQAPVRKPPAKDAQSLMKEQWQAMNEIRSRPNSAMSWTPTRPASPASELSDAAVSVTPPLKRSWSGGWLPNQSSPLTVVKSERNDAERSWKTEGGRFLAEREAKIKAAAAEASKLAEVHPRHMSPYERSVHTAYTSRNDAANRPRGSWMNPSMFDGPHITRDGWTYTRNRVHSEVSMRRIGPLVS